MSDYQKKSGMCISCTSTNKEDTLNSGDKPAPDVSEGTPTEEDSSD